MSTPDEVILRLEKREFQAWLEYAKSCKCGDSEEERMRLFKKWNLADTALHKVKPRSEVPAKLRANQPMNYVADP